MGVSLAGRLCECLALERHVCIEAGGPLEACLTPGPVSGLCGGLVWGAEVGEVVVQQRNNPCSW